MDRPINKQIFLTPPPNKKLRTILPHQLPLFSPITVQSTTQSKIILILIQKPICDPAIALSPQPLNTSKHIFKEGRGKAKTLQESLSRLQNILEAIHAKVGLLACYWSCGKCVVYIVRHTHVRNLALGRDEGKSLACVMGNACGLLFVCFNCL